MKRISAPSTVVMTAQEAERLGVHCPNFFAVYDLVRNMAMRHGWETQWGMMVFLSTIYNAGRVDGIRAERARRQRKDAPNED